MLVWVDFFLAQMRWSISRGAIVQKNNMLNENSSFRKCIGDIRKQLYSTFLGVNQRGGEFDMQGGENYNARRYCNVL